MAKSNDEVARASVILNGQQANATLKEIEASARALNAQLRLLPVNSKEFADKSADLQKVRTRMSEIKGEINATGFSLSKLADGFNRYFAVVTAGIAAFSGIAFSIKNLISSNAELSDSLANIRKTTGFTATEVENLNKQLGKIDTRTSRQDLREMGVVAGQLGMAKDQVYSFVESVDKLNVALGDEISGGAEVVATTMGTLRNVLTDMKSANIADDMLRIGNAVNELGASGFATAPVIADFANRIGGIGITLGLTSDEVLGLSATLQELNVSTERGGTAVTKILQKMTTNVSDFAKIAGIPVKEFTDLVNKDLFGAFTKVLEGSKRGGQSATLLAGIIKELEVSGAGASEVFAKLGGNTDMLNEKVGLAGKSLQNTDSILNEFNIKNQTLGAVLDKVSKNFYSLITMPGITEFFKNQVLHIYEFINWLKNLPQFIEKYKVTIIVATGALLAWTTAKMKLTASVIANNLQLAIGTALKVKDNAILAVLIAKEELLTIWKGNGTVATKLATTAQRAWNAAVSANPIGILIAGITALVTAIKLYDKYNKEAIQNEKIKASTLERMSVVNKMLSSSYDLFNAQVRTLNQLSTQEKIDLQDKIDKNIKLAEVELVLMRQRQQKIKEDNSKPTLMQRTWNFVSTAALPGGAAVASIQNASDAAKNGQKAADELNESISEIETNLKKLKETQSAVYDITRAESIADAIQGKGLDNLEEKLSKYQVALKNTLAGSEDFVRIQNKIKETNKEISKFSLGGISADDKSLKKQLSDYENLKEKLDEYIKALQEQAIAEYKANGPVDPSITKALTDKIAALTKEKEAIDAIIKSLIERSKYNDNAPISKMPVLGPDGYKSPGDKNKLRDKNEVEAPLQPGWTMKGFDDKESETDTQIWAKKANNVTNYAAVVVSQLTSVDTVMSAMENSQLSRDEALNEKKKSNLKNQLDKKLITQKQYDAAVLKLDADMDAKKRKLIHDQAVRSKALSLAQAVVNVAQGVTAALSMPPPASYVMAALTGILGAIQIGLIAGQEVPQAKKGRYNVIGEEDGKLYKDVPYQENFTGIPGRPMLVNETGNELVIDQDTTSKLLTRHPEIIQQIQQARIQGYSDWEYSSKVASIKTPANPQIDIPFITSAISYSSIPQYAKGNYTQLDRFSQGNSTQLNQDSNSEFLDAIKAFNSTAKSGIRAYIVYDDLDLANSKVDQIKLDVANS